VGITVKKSKNPLQLHCTMPKLSGIALNIHPAMHLESGKPTYWWNIIVLLGSQVTGLQS
jgi:hypothetical protein